MHKVAVSGGYHAASLGASLAASCDPSHRSAGRIASGRMRWMFRGLRYAFAAAAMSLAVASPLPALAEAPAATQKVVIQVSDADPAKWSLALNNARNIQADLGADNVAVEIVAYGPGIGMLKSDSAVGNRIREASGSGVKVVACENTMRGQKLSQADMLDGIGYVPSGVVEIMRKQQQGWGYIRP